MTTPLDKVNAQFPIAPVGPTVGPTTYVRANIVSILSKIFDLLVGTVKSLQEVATSQAQRLKFLVAWQKAYTDKLGQVPTFVGGNNISPISANSTDDTIASNARQDLNNLNSSYTTQLQNARSLVEDDAKSVQSQVNQTNDTVTQQSNMATAIIQQFSTILGSIFR